MCQEAHHSDSSLNIAVSVRKMLIASAKEVCFVGVHYCAKTQSIFTKIGGKVAHWSWMKPLGFAG